VADSLPLWKRLLGFSMIPAIAALSPLLVLPVVSRVAGPEGWSSAIAGESIGTFGAIAIAYGWSTIGPALVSIAQNDATRGRLYRDSLVVRLIVAVVALPAVGIACWLVASPGYGLLAALMGLQGALIALSFTWYSVGLGRPGAIALYDAIPRLIVTAAAAAAILLTGIVELYPLAGITVTLVGTGLFTWRTLRRYPSSWPRVAEIPGLFRTGAPVALNDAALGAYSAVPAPLVNVTAPPLEASGFASADKMVKLGQFLPLTLANALQAWIAEGFGPRRSSRIRAALWAHAALGLTGLLGLAFLGGWATRILFGDTATAATNVLAALGLGFAFFSLRTSMTRHILFPAGRSKLVMSATLVGTAVGVPAMLVLANVWGPLGVAIAYALTEFIATTILVAPCIAAMRRLDSADLVAP
jgi:PST family polysaccharide transporter